MSSTPSHRGGAALQYCQNVIDVSCLAPPTLRTLLTGRRNWLDLSIETVHRLARGPDAAR